jgi:hypothetical protein
MRHRSTWKQDRQAGTSRTADDIYDMNQDHAQPSPTEYENGDPNSWAETPTKNEYVTQSYDGDSEARNEVGFPEFAPSTFDHKDSKEWGGSGKYDNQRGGMTASARKATAAERVARSMLRTANKELIEQQAVDLMSLPDNVLVATIKRLDAVSPNALSKEVKLRRCYACVKLASAMLPSKENFATEAVWHGHVEAMGRTLATLDDPTLRAIIKISVDAGKTVVAKDDEEEKKDDKAAAAAPVAAPKKDEKKEEPVAAAPPKDDKKDAEVAASDEEGDEGDTACAPEMETGCMSTEDMDMLNSMLAPPVADPLAAPGVPGAAPPPAPLTSLFGDVAPPAAVPMMASDSGFDISFDGDDEGQSQLASDGSELDSVFSDNDEVRAQREIRASEEEQRGRELGFQPTVQTRTASAAPAQGAKRLGAVRRAPTPAAKNELDALWA